MNSAAFFFHPLVYLLGLMSAILCKSLSNQGIETRLFPMTAVNIIFWYYFIPIIELPILFTLFVGWFFTGIVCNFFFQDSRFMKSYKIWIIILFLTTVLYLSFYRLRPFGSSLQGFYEANFIPLLSQFSLLFLMSRWFIAARYLYLGISPEQAFSHWLPKIEEQRSLASAKNNQSWKRNRSTYYASIVYGNWLLMAPLNFLGPIVMPRDFRPASLTLAEGARVLKNFALGCFQALYLAPLFASWSQVESWWRYLLFTCYIYFQFNGFSLAAQAFCYSLGVNVPDNFNKPWLSKTPAEIWNRWHISLNQGLRELLYFPLCSVFQKLFGNSLGKIAPNTSLLLSSSVATAIICLVSALWHGFSLSYTLWGVYWTIVLITFNIFQTFIPKWNNRDPNIWLMRFASLFVFILGNAFFWNFFKELNAH